MENTRFTVHAVQATITTQQKKIRILVADDHTALRRSLSQLLKQEPDIEIIGEAVDGQSAVELACKLIPDVILMDVIMPKLNGIDATRTIHQTLPGIRIIGLSMSEESERAQAMRDAGAAEYFAKSAPATNLLSAIRLTRTAH